MKQAILLTMLSLWLNTAAFADVHLPKIFGNGMVLQRDAPISVWGWANPGERVSVSLNKQTKTTNAASDGKWHVQLGVEKAGGPYELTVKSTNTLTFTDVLVGDVWICSGQSNMEWPLNAAANAEQEIAAANYPQIRHIKIPNTVAGAPQSDIDGEATWQAASPATAGGFTAVGYFYARKLQETLDIPIGLINTSWGGTMVETWTSREAFEQDPEFAGMIAQLPRLDIDSLQAAYAARALQRVEQLQGKLPNADEVPSWASPSFDDQRWLTMNVPDAWEGQQLVEFDGVVWFRTAFALAANQAGAAAVLELGEIDDNDEVYLNGTKVGNTNGYNIKRQYAVPAGLLKTGQNWMAVRIEDTGGGGGFTGSADDIKLTIGNNTVPLAGEWKFRVAAIHNSDQSVGPNAYPTLLFNAMVNPLIPYTIKGAIWYQGETNAGRAYQYRKAFPLLINDWRKRWGLGDFPFYFVQLASFKAEGGTSATGSGWAELREAQTMTLSLPHTGMAVTTDIGNTDDIHPRNKQDVGARLALVALHDAYGKMAPYSGPTYNAFQIKGSQAMVTFDHAEDGLSAHGAQVMGFELAGKDRQFKPARATISGHTVILQSEGVSKPVAVRYAWADDAGESNLFNGAGLPAVPFRTDDWPGITEAVKYQP
ncbi:sialate O-acetylesterase [Parapedobacter koreensis]|uniref:Sialate O-acetylesterase n=1 Tax=Parapedobacter koreensis TaxID=332977 RepID=A0A1H7U3T6_9SPHI|nr:sialate O-acetylesterase [Parapedobacter koreensis]SEL91425.1 sialate O-acetylesterase [Parapedobacter koreensis]